MIQLWLILPIQCILTDCGGWVEGEGATLSLWNNNNRLFMAPNLVSAQSTYRNIKATLISYYYVIQLTATAPPSVWLSWQARVSKWLWGSSHSSYLPQPCQVCPSDLYPCTSALPGLFLSPRLFLPPHCHSVPISPPVPTSHCQCSYPPACSYFPIATLFLSPRPVPTSTLPVFLSPRPVPTTPLPVFLSPGLFQPPHYQSVSIPWPVLILSPHCQSVPIPQPVPTSIPF